MQLKYFQNFHIFQTHQGKNYTVAKWVICYQMQWNRNSVLTLALFSTSFYEIAPNKRKSKYSQTRLSQISGDLTNHIWLDEIRVTVLYTVICMFGIKGNEGWKYHDCIMHGGKERGKFMTSCWSSWQAGIKGQFNQISEESQLRPFWLRRMI